MAILRILVLLALNIFWVPLCGADAQLPRGEDSITWPRYEALVMKQVEQDRQEGLSYVISGFAALIGGIAGEEMSEDYVDRGIYSIFQSIGVASIGYGAYVWTIGGEDRLLYDTVQPVGSIDAKDRGRLATSFLLQKTKRRKRDRVLRAVTHGILGGLSFYSASKQTNKDFKGGFQFIGAAHTLACISFAFEF